MKKEAERREVLLSFFGTLRADLAVCYEELQWALDHPEQRFRIDKVIDRVLSIMSACKSVSDSQARMDAATDVSEEAGGSLPVDGDAVGRDQRDGTILSHAVLASTAPRSRQRRGSGRRRR